MDDLRERIAATRPTADEVARVDVEEIVRRGRRQRRAVRAASVGTAALVAVVVLVTGAGTILPGIGPEVVDEPGPRMVDAPIAVLQTDPGSEDVLPAEVRDQLDLDDAAAGTVRLARRTPTQRWFVYLDDPPPESTTVDELLCLVGFVAADPSQYTGVCSGREMPAPATSRVVMQTRSGELGAAGVVTDGAATVGAAAEAGGMASEMDPDVPVVNNVFVVDPRADEETATAGRGPDRFCAAAPPPDAGPTDTPGSANHLARLEVMATRAPLEVAADVYMVWDHVRVHVSPDDPAAADTYPAPVQEAIARVDAFIAASCAPSGQDRPGTISWDGATTGSTRLTETLATEWDPRDRYVRVRVGSPDGVVLDIRGQVRDGRLDPETRVVNFSPIGGSFHATELGPFETEPPDACTVVFDTLALGAVDGEIDCTLTAAEDEATIRLIGTFTTQ